MVLGPDAAVVGLMIGQQLHLVGELVPCSLEVELALADPVVVWFATLYVAAIGEGFPEEERSRGHGAAGRVQRQADEGELLGGRLRST
jgi:hypothetical protein